MKKLLFTGLLGLGLLLPANISASANSTVSAKELFKKPGKRKTKTSRKSKSKDQAILLRRIIQAQEARVAPTTEISCMLAQEAAAIITQGIVNNI